MSLLLVFLVRWRRTPIFSRESSCFGFWVNACFLHIIHGTYKCIVKFYSFYFRLSVHAICSFNS